MQDNAAYLMKMEMVKMMTFQVKGKACTDIVRVKHNTAKSY